MPVRNGQRFIRPAIDSLLAQTYRDFELIICDNASTDSTAKICQDYVARDPRVRYHRQPANVGPAANYNACFELARGELFRWHAHDDMCEPDHLAACVDALDSDRDAVLAFPGTVIVDESGQTIEEYSYHPRTASTNVVERFAELVMVNHRRHRAVEIFGLMRASALRRTPLQEAYARGDSVLLVRLALLGRFVELPRRLFLSRCHAQQSMQMVPQSGQDKSSVLRRMLGTGPLPPPEWWDESRAGRINFPEWNLLKRYWRSIGRSPLRMTDRLRCCGVMLDWVAWNLPKLARDVIFAAEKISKQMMERLATRPRDHAHDGVT
jgi:glycosyltransferase involved in cell wall biosynthesis